MFLFLCVCIHQNYNTFGFLFPIKKLFWDMIQIKTKHFSLLDSSSSIETHWWFMLPAWLDCCQLMYSHKTTHKIRQTDSRWWLHIREKFYNAFFISCVVSSQTWVLILVLFVDLYFYFILFHKSSWLDFVKNRFKMLCCVQSRILYLFLFKWIDAWINMIPFVNYYCTNYGVCVQGGGSKKIKETKAICSYWKEVP